MRNLVVLLALVFVLAACVEPTTPMPLATSTATPAPSATPTTTLTPTITPTPTETPPPGATGTNSSTGEYTKTIEENGKTVTFVWKQLQFGNDVQNGVTGHWFESRMAKGPINLTGYGENATDFWGEITLNLNVYSVEGFRNLDKLGYIYHPDGSSEFITKGYPGYSLPSLIAFDLFLRYNDLLAGQPGSTGKDKYEKYYGKYFTGPADAYNPTTPTDADKARIADDQQATRRALNDGASIQVGDSSWQPRLGYEVYWIDEASAKADPSMYLSGNLYWKVMVKDGKLIAILAPAPWMSTRLSWPTAHSREATFSAVTLFPLEAVLTTQDLSKDISWLDYQGFGNYGTSAHGYLSIGGKSITAQFIAFSANP